MQSVLPVMAGMERDEFALRVAQAIRYFDTKELYIGVDKQLLENAVIMFVLPIDAIRNYKEHFREEPYIGGYLRILVDLYVRALRERAKGWR